VKIESIPGGLYVSLHCMRDHKADPGKKRCGYVWREETDKIRQMTDSLVN